MEVKDSYETSLYLATLGKDGPSGGLFHKEEALTMVEKKILIPPKHNGVVIKNLK